MRIFGFFYPEIIKYDSIVYYNDTGSGARVIQAMMVDFFPNGHIDSLRIYDYDELQYVWDGKMNGNTYELSVFKKIPNLQRYSMEDKFRIYFDQSGRDSVMENYWKDGKEASHFKYYYNDSNKPDSIIFREDGEPNTGKVYYYYTDHNFDSCLMYQDTALALSIMAYKKSGDMDSLKIIHHLDDEVVMISFIRKRGKVSEMIYTGYDPFRNRKAVYSRKKYLLRKN